MYFLRRAGWALPCVACLWGLPACFSDSSSSTTPGSDAAATPDRISSSDATSPSDTGSSSREGGSHPDAGDSGAVIKDAGPGDSVSVGLVPAKVLDLTNWKLQLPVGDGGAEEIMQPQLASFSLPPYFVAEADGGGVVFQANCNGVTTSGSLYPRSELREMVEGGLVEAAWSLASGTHTMIVREAITHLPLRRPEVVAAQIHDDLSPGVILELRLDGETLFVQGANGTNEGTLDTSYVVGTLFTAKFVVSGGMVQVFYNDLTTPKFTFTPPSPTDSGTYFKAGCYTQSNLDAGDLATAYGQVVITSLQVMHQ
jgi:Alginate lyase